MATGLLLGWTHQHFKRQRTAPPPVVVPVPIAQTESEQAEPDDLAYPDNIGIGPFDIEYFIDGQPRADLDPLWKRLKIKPSIEFAGLYGKCGDCKAQSFNYNLDDDADQEIVLRIADEPADSYRYLIFKERSYGDVKLLGHIDAHGKYRPSTHFVMLGGGKAWLVVEQQAANGSGLAAYLQTVYQVSSHGVTPRVTYFSEVSQYGYDSFPSKYFTGQPVSIEVKDGRVVVSVAYKLRYSYHDNHSREDAFLFTKRQLAVLESSYRGRQTVVSGSRPNITTDELETIYNFDSMGPDDFLTYNQRELRTIALGKDSEKKRWLKEFLAECSNSAIKRELVALLR